MLLRKEKTNCRFCGIQSLTIAPFPVKPVRGRPPSTVCPKCYSLEDISLIEEEQSATGEVLKEVMLRQQAGQPKRLMVDSQKLSLIFWFDDAGDIFGFQLNLSNGEYDTYTFTWTQESKAQFARVNPIRRRFETNTLEAVDDFPKNSIIQLFKEFSGNLKADYREIVLEKIRGY